MPTAWLRRSAAGQILLADDLGQLEEMLAHVLAGDGAEIAHQLDLLGREADRVGGRRRFRMVMEKEGHGHAMELGGSGAAAGAGPVLAVLVLLHRLEADADGVADLLLARAGEETGLAQPPPDRQIDMVRTTLARLAPRPLRVRSTNFQLWLLHANHPLSCLTATEGLYSNQPPISTKSGSPPPPHFTTPPPPPS